MILIREIAAAVAAVVVEYEFVAAQRIAPEAFIAYRALAISAVAYATVQAHYIMAFILITCGIGDGGKTGYSNK